ncbi:MAG TPA: RidA family protein [Myxococcota bacterium]|nr:RidA family protein [Myxococcota bacterium]
MKPISTPEAPAAIGPYSQAVRAGDTVYLSGQIPLDPATMQIVAGFEAQARRVFANLRAVCRAAGGDFDRVVRLTIYLTDLANFPRVNEVMAECFREPFPARVTVGISSLPRGAEVEVDAVMYLG